MVDILLQGLEFYMYLLKLLSLYDDFPFAKKFHVNLEDAENVRNIDLLDAYWKLMVRGGRFWFVQFVVIYLILFRIPHIHDIFKYEKIKLVQSIISALHGLLCGLTGLIIMLDCMDDVLYSESKLVHEYILIGCGYMFYDTIMMVIVQNSSLANESHPRKDLNRQSPTSIKRLIFVFKSKASIFIHHLTIIFILFPIMLRYIHLGNFFYGCFFFMEFSSIFVNARNVIKHYFGKSNPIYLINGTMMILSFLI